MNFNFIYYILILYIIIQNALILIDKKTSGHNSN